jgi:O-methyltransferase domain/Dimerisation domain
MKTDSVTPQQIFEVAFAFRKSKALFSAVELGLFSVLGDGPMDGEALRQRLKIDERGARDFFDALVALGFLDRDDDGRYANRSDSARFLDRGRPDYLGDVLEYLNVRAYPAWRSLTTALLTGAPQSGPFEAGGFAAFYADDSVRRTFVKGMTGGSVMPAKALAAKFPWHSYRTVIDIGTAEGSVLVAIARAHRHLTGGGFDLPVIEPAFTRYVRKYRLGSRLRFYSGDFLESPLPTADVLIMGRVLHDWDLATRKMLLKKAHQALSPGGALIVWESLIDDARRVGAQCLLSSLNMLLQTSAGSEFTGTECAAWMREAGFGEIRFIPLDGIYTAAIAIKT